ncbi:hypothetical protein DV096_19845 [Bradymonadaceae bacterium TMQ3]|nr:hypothetical protein DV096_19845 [Bradymonadaceae bacterium TMQ3]
MEGLASVEFIAILAFLLLVCLATFLKWRHWEKSASAWREVADHCGLHFWDRGVAAQQLEGGYRGYDVQVSTETFRMDQGRYADIHYVTTCVVKALEPALGEVWMDPREPYAHEIGAWKATTKSFAAAFRRNDVGITRWLADDPEVRLVMERVQAAGDNLTLRHGELRRSRGHLFVSFGDLLTFINTSIDVAAKIDSRARQFPVETTQEGEAGEEVVVSVSNNAVW